MLAREVTLQGQRALIGKVNMNSRRNDGYYETTEASIRNTMNFIEEIEQMKVKTYTIITCLNTCILQ